MNNKLITILIMIIILILGGITTTDNLFTNHTSNNISSTQQVVENGEYVTVNEVAAYIKEFHKLPSNYITKKEAQSLGWEGGSLSKYAPDKSIGGDTFTNRQEILPINHKYIECDIDANGTTRGSKRIVYSTDEYKVYYTSDHYKTFNEI